MDGASVLNDSTDWLSTALPSFAQLENALRCQVCKDLFNTPMITSCSHTFCSLCIRRCFADDGKCPTCRTSDSDSRLRRNWTAQEMVDVWHASRQKALDLASSAGDPAPPPQAKKRKLEVPDSEHEDGEEEVVRPRRKTRSSARQSRANNGEVEVINLDGSEQSGEDPEPNDGLVACPLCKQRMKEEAVFPHLDHCTGPAAPRSTRASDRSRTSTDSPHFAQQLGARASTTNNVPPTRLPQLGYTLLNDMKLRKKLKELGIPNHGPRALLIRRHKEWINLWNANCDSTRPLTKRQLLSDLDRWERSQGSGRSQSSWTGRGAGDVMDKEFKRDGWAESNKNQYDDLIAQARSRVKRERESAAAAAAEEATGKENGAQQEEQNEEYASEKRDAMEQEAMEQEAMEQEAAEQREDAAEMRALNGIDVEEHRQQERHQHHPNPLSPPAAHGDFTKQPSALSEPPEPPPLNSPDAVDAVRAQVDQASLHSSQIDQAAAASTAAPPEKALPQDPPADADMPDVHVDVWQHALSQILIPRSPDASAAAD